VSTYPIKELIKPWETEILTMQQIIGYILQHLLALEEQVKDLKRRLPKSLPNKKDEAKAIFAIMRVRFTLMMVEFSHLVQFTNGIHTPAIAPN